MAVGVSALAIATGYLSDECTTSIITSLTATIDTADEELSATITDIQVI